MTWLGTVTMSGKDLDRLEILGRVAERRLTQRRAAEHLGLSERQVRRLCRALGQQGAAGLASRKRGRPSTRKLPAAARDPPSGVTGSDTRVCESASTPRWSRVEPIVQGFSRRAASGARSRLPLSPAALLFLRGRDADGRVRLLVEERRGLRPVLGALALRLVKRRLYEPLGFRSLGDYARERLGVTTHVVREWARVSEALASLPRCLAAVVAGEISWSVARRAVAHATPETDEAFATALRGRTVRAAEEMLRVVFGTEQGAETHEFGEERVHVDLPKVDPALWAAALELARRMAGEALPVWECAEAIAAEALGAIPPDVVAKAAEAMGMEDSSAPFRRQRAAPGVSGAIREHGLRHAAFPHLRWDGSSPFDEADLTRLSEWAATASPHALDSALRRALRRLQRIDHDLGQLLRQVQGRGLHRELGFPSFARYAEERVGVSPRTARRWVRFARLGPAARVVANAFREGALTAKQAILVAEAVPPAQQADAVAFARAVTLRRLEDALGARTGAGGAISFAAPPEAANVFRLALAAARLHLAADASSALRWMLEHATAAWREQGEQFDDYADFARDGWRCTAPGCTARRNLHSHHIVFRSHGGPDEAWNRTTLCAFHHLRGVHARTIACSGRAPEGLTFELGIRANGPPLLRCRSGDRIAGPTAGKLSRARRAPQLRPAPARRRSHRPR